LAARGFTETWLKNLKPEKARRDFTEPGRRGFMLRVWPGGEKSFVYRFHRGGKQRVMTLGTYPAMSLDRAHREYELARDQFKNGQDPIDERASAKARQEAQERRRSEASAITTRNVIAEWAWHYARRERKRPQEAIRLLRNNIADVWKDRPAIEIRRRDAVLLLDRVVARGAHVMANRLAALAKQAFGFAVKRDLIEVNPFADIDPPGGKEETVERWLKAEELKTFWLALDESATAISRPVRIALKLILVTAQRPGEVAGAAWAEIDLNAGVWRIPASRAKNGREHVVPLSPLAIELLRELHLVTEPKRTKKRPEALPRSPFILPAAHVVQKADEPLSVRALSRALRNNLDEKAGKVFGLEPFTPHDLRRTAASHMTALGTARLHVAKVLNHTDSDTTAIYDRHAYLDEKRKALELWAGELRLVVAGKARKVVPLKAKARG
jgi:integrase